MKKNFTILVLMFATCLIFLPATGAASTPGDKNISIAGLDNENLVLQQRRGRGRRDRNWDDDRRSSRRDRDWNDDRRSRRRNGTYNGYRNYGQYRRTQVGNRRYRNERRYIWRDGRRVSIWRRIFY
jgi:hypothetical protein